MEATNAEDIPSTRAAVQPTGAFAHNDVDNDDQGPSVSSQPTVIIYQTTIIQTTNTNTYSLELPVLLLFFSWNLSGTVFQNQVLYQSCILNYNESTCNQLANEDIPDDLEVICQFNCSIVHLIFT